MKTKMMFVTAVLMSLCLTACGEEPVQINVNMQADTEIAAATGITTAETTAAVTETAAAADTTAAQTVSEQTTAVQTTAALKAECPYSADDLVGEWSMPGTFGTRNNTLTVRKDGSVILRYAAGGTRFGKARIDTEEHPDGSVSYWYAVYDDESTPWISFACGEQPVDRISSGQDGEMQFVRISLADVAVEKMNNLTFLMKSMSGGGGDLETDPTRTVTDGNQTYTLVTDDRFAISSLGKIAFERLLEETVTGDAFTHWKGMLDDSFREDAYILTSGAHGFYTFETAHGVTLSDQTDSSFTATTNDTSQLDGTGVAYFVFDGVNWTIERYEFQ